MSQAIGQAEGASLIVGAIGTDRATAELAAGGGVEALMRALEESVEKAQHLIVGVALRSGHATIAEQQSVEPPWTETQPVWRVFSAGMITNVDSRSTSEMTRCTNCSIF